MMDPTLLRFQQMFGNMQGQQPMIGNDLPSQGGFAGQPVMLPERLGATEPMGIQAQVIDPSMLGKDTIPQTPEMNIAQRLQQLYSPETAANDRLTALLNQYPQRENPGILAKIVGSLIGGARGPDAADRAMYGGYYRDVEDWENQVKPASHLAPQERYNNQNERQYANQVITQELNRDKFDHTIEKDKATAANRERRTKVYEFKARNPNQTIKLDKAGNFVAINPQTLQTTAIRDADGNPISGREMSWEEKQEILQENALERIDEMGKVGLNRIGAQGAVQGELIDKREEVKDSSLTPEQERSARLSRAEALVNEHPELSGWIENDGKSVKIRETYTPGMFGIAVGRKAENPATRKAIVDHIINGKPLVLPKETKGKDTNQTINPNNTKLSEGKIKVISPDGIPGMIPMSRLDAYLKGGYKKAN